MTDRRFDEEQPQGPTVRDKRRIDPLTYQVREPQPVNADTVAPAPEAAPIQPAGADTQVSELTTALAERTADLQRLQAEYVNYKRRVDRDRDVSRRASVEGVLKDFLSVLDDIRSAREHDEFNGAFRAVGEQVERVTVKYGLEEFGTKGDPFNPHIHEALLHSYVDGVQGPTCVEILQPGYRIGDRVLRPARVAVAESDPSAPTASQPTTSQGATESAEEPEVHGEAAETT